MLQKHKVKQGECISSIAYNYGFFPDNIWNNPANAKLKEKRKDQNILSPSDLVVIPDKTLREETGATGERHHFRRKGVPEIFRVCIKFDGEPRANEPYTLNVNGIFHNGTSDDEGNIECPIPPNTHEVKLYLGSEPEMYEYTFSLGHIDPITEIRGIQERLKNLGFNCGLVEKDLGSETKKAIKAFQAKYEFPVTGQVDEETREKLILEYGC